MAIKDDHYFYVVTLPPERNPTGCRRSRRSGLWQVSIRASRRIRALLITCIADNADNVDNDDNDDNSDNPMRPPLHCSLERCIYRP
ncbi:MAG: hypothetical protein K2N35_17555 [Muribaculaceae bacterium]|nr:hypothetical protein [Muribaculaceae bacterium]